MFKTKNEITALHRANVRGGNGAPEFRYLFSPEEMGGRVELLGVITLAPGESVGMHPHETNAEAYYIISGEVKKENNNALGFFDYVPAWYRKHFFGGFICGFVMGK